MRKCRLSFLAGGPSRFTVLVNCVLFKSTLNHKEKMQRASRIQISKEMGVDEGALRLCVCNHAAELSISTLLDSENGSQSLQDH